MEKGFTLIELLVVIAIVAILSVVVILTLNPAELLRQARDSNRVSDMSVLKHALGIYLADVRSPVLANGSTYTCYVSAATTTGANCAGAFSATFAATSATTTRKTDGTGWMPVNFGLISSGSPIAQLPIDPTNDATTYYYAYAANTSTLGFEINANMESARYTNGGPGDVESKDGGNNANRYEVGTDLTF